VPQRELRNNYRGLLRDVEAGEELTITVKGRPVAKLVPATGRRRLLPAGDLDRILQGDPIDPGAFFADVRPPDADRIAGDGE
jgi:prevent-host-death family protein